MRALAIACLMGAMSLLAAAGARGATLATRSPDVAAAPVDGTSSRALALAAVAERDRSEEDRRSDPRRHPVDLLAFAEVATGMRVADLGAGAGYTTELLARVVGERGVVYGQNTPFVVEHYVSESWPRRLSKEVMSQVVRVDSVMDAPLPPSVRSLDLVMMIFFYHDTLYANVDRAAMNAAIFSALAPGGAFVIVDHRARAGAGPEAGEKLHRVDEALLRREVEAAGFRLESTADFLRYPPDRLDQPFFERDAPTDAFAHRYRKP